MSSRAEKAGGHLKREEKKKSAREKESDEKRCYKKRKNGVEIWRLQLGAMRLATEVLRNNVGDFFF